MRENGTVWRDGARRVITRKKADPDREVRWARHQEAYTALEKRFPSIDVDAVKDIAWLWEEYVLVPEEILSDGAKELRKILLTLFSRPGSEIQAKPNALLSDNPEEVLRACEEITKAYDMMDCGALTDIALDCVEKVLPKWIERTQDAEKVRDLLVDKIARMATVMAAAADEIERHWDAHCDDKGYGPTSLIMRLKGEHVEYGGTCYPAYCCSASNDAEERAKLMDALEACVKALEMLHPMNPEEPCVIFEAWRKAKEALGQSVPESSDSRPLEGDNKDDDDVRPVDRGPVQTEKDRRVQRGKTRSVI